MTVMSAQAPLPLAPAESVPVGHAAALVEDEGGGQVFIRGELAYVWDAGDAAGRRLAAAQLVRIKAATQVQVATAFGVGAVTVWRWAKKLDVAGVAGIGPDRKGPKGPSKLTPDLVAEIRARRQDGQSLRVIGSAVGVVLDTVRRALAQEDQGAAQAHTPQLEPASEGAALAEDAHAEGSNERGGQDRHARAGGLADEQEELPVLAEPPERGLERGLARWGLLGHADPVFHSAARVPLAGLLAAVPALAGTGLLGCARQTYQQLPAGFYGLDTVLVEAVLRCLAGEPRAEGATRVDPVALGRVLGMDRAPEVKTIRRKLAQLAGRGKAEELLAGMAAHHLHQIDPELAAVLYVDGHTRAYHGKRRIAKTHVARLKFPAPATLETWVADAAGDPVLVVMAEPGASLAAELRRLLPQLREAVGDDRRVLVGFDRGGWSPALFQAMDAAGFDVLTWRKGEADDVTEDEFTDVTHVDDDGRAHQWNAAESVVDLPLDAAGNQTFRMRQVTRRDGPGAKQIHILTTVGAQQLSTAAVNYRMGSRWRQENAFRYGRMHFDLDSHDSYRHSDDDPTRSVPNPAKKQAQNHVAAARAHYEREVARADATLLQLRSPTSTEPVHISNAEHNRITAGASAAEDALAAAEEHNRHTPARLPLGQVHPGQQVLEVQTKLLTHAIKIAAYNTATALARDVRLHTSYARAKHEAHVLIRHVLTHSGDIDPDPDNGTLTVRLDPLPTGRATRAVAELCEHLTATETRYPGTDLKIRYHVKSRR
ncbi:MAG TPA: hypothetical protein VFX70_03275 [Mycobacteriales bacterium]|nr:hypothetical protein [Mycobacteriales bacterium]